MKTTVDLGGPVHVERLGSGPPMLLVHGLGASHVHWLAVAREFARRHRVHMPDLPGFGLSPLAGRSPGVRANAELLVEMLDRFREPVILVGNSMGAMLSMLAAHKRREAVSALVLVAPPAPRPPLAPLEARLAVLFSAYTWPVLGEVTRFLFVRLHGPEGVVRNAFKVCCVEPDNVSRAVVEAAGRVAGERPLSDEVHAFLGAYRSLWFYLLDGRRFDAVARAIEAPTLVIHGGQDRLIPTVVRRRLRRARSDWTYVTLPRAGHMPQLDDPVGFTSTVSSWLADVQRRARAAG